MTQISPRVFHDEIDNQFEIRKHLKAENFQKVFQCVYCNIIGEQRMKAITAKMLLELSLLNDRSYTYQMLENLVVLRLLKKEKSSYSKANYYIPINLPWWEDFHKELCQQKEDKKV
jgi:hypothetical protein